MMLSKSRLLASHKHALSRFYAPCSSLKDFRQVSINQLHRFKSSVAPVGVISNEKSSHDLSDIGKCPHRNEMGNITEKNTQKNLSDTLSKPVIANCGEFNLSTFSYGVPGIGRGVYGTQYFVTDPNEFLKVLRKEGPYPFGAITMFWPTIQALNDIQSTVTPLFGTGNGWLKFRRFMQTDLLTPSSAKGYVPGLVEAAEIAIKDAPSYASNMNQYLAYVAFDLFLSLSLGEFSHVASTGENLNEKNKQFCIEALELLENIAPLLFQEPHMKWFTKFGIKSKRYETFESNIKTTLDTVTEKFESFYERKENGTLNEHEESSYCSRAIDRMKSDPNIDKTDLINIIHVMFAAAIDTTKSYLSWVIVHLALNPSVQDKMYDEMKMNLASTEDGKLCESILTKSRAPYLHAILRECHRMTPVVVPAVSGFKDNSDGDVEIYGVEFPKNTAMFTLNSYVIGMDPKHVPDCEVFRPERWFEDEVEARKGSVTEFLDHPLYRDPFSAGARKCPGYRVANYEMFVTLSQLTKEFKISFVDDKIKSWRDVEHKLGTAIIPTLPELKFEPRK